MGCITSRSSEEGEKSSRRSPAAEVLDDYDLLSEILLRLPPQPSSLPRASLVCKYWRSLVSDPGFTRRFRLRHRRHPPLLGCFVKIGSGLSFQPTMEAPNRIPAVRFSSQSDNRFVLGCHHGLVLLFDKSLKQLVVWDPVTADQRSIAAPGDAQHFHGKLTHGTVLRAAGDAQHFQVVLAAADDKDEQHGRMLACLYSSETGVWGDLISMPIPSNTPTSSLPISVLIRKSARLVGNSLYWLLAGRFVGFLEFDLERQNLTMIPVPADGILEGKSWDFMVMRAEGGDLGFFFLSGFTAHLWKRTTNGDGVASWGLARTIELDKLLSLNSDEKSEQLRVLGYAEYNNVVLLRTYISCFMIHLESLQFKKLSGHNLICNYHPFETVYAAGPYGNRASIYEARRRGSGNH